MLRRMIMPQNWVANFDSTASMLRATSAYLKESSHANIGVLPQPLAPLVNLAGLGINRLPVPWREKFYQYSGATETISQKKLHHFRADKLSKWAAGLYPSRPYPAVMIGSSNGAAVHLCAALGIPWLPQSHLIPVRRTGVHPDEPWQDLSWSIEPARQLLDANPDIELHHMLDPVQDLLMSRVLAYFRIKRLTLGPHYEHFLLKNLEPGGTIYVVDCRLKWPTTLVSERHIFQFGAAGGADFKDLFEGSERVEEYLRRYGSYRRRWDPPAPDGERPEAEWGFAEPLRDDIEAFAERHGFGVRRLVFDQPQDLSPLVADFYRWWYRKRGIVANRLVGESFLLLEPYWMMRVGAVPFWMIFPTEPMDRILEEYLERSDPFDEIGLMLFSHGVESVGVVPIERWRQILGRARRKGTFLGVDEQAFPRDFAAMSRYHTAFPETFTARYPLPGPLPPWTLDEFLAQSQREYPVGMEELRAGKTLH